MSTERAITIKGDDLSCNSLVLEQKGRGNNKYTSWGLHGTSAYNPILDANDDYMGHEITLTETEVCKYSAKALEELASAEEVLSRAQDRADSLREFSRQLYAGQPQLTLEATNS